MMMDRSDSVIFHLLVLIYSERNNQNLFRRIETPLIVSNELGEK